MEQKTILIVDDFANTRYVTRLTLQRSGYKILEAGDGLEALQCFDGQKIDLVITDYNMPNMNGLELVEAIRQLPDADYKYVPILLLTTETDQEKKNRALRAGITGWIQKPFTFDRFLKIVKKAFK